MCTLGCQIVGVGENIIREWETQWEKSHGGGGSDRK